MIPQGLSMLTSCPVYCVLIQINTHPTIKPPMHPYHLSLSITTADLNIIAIHTQTKGLIVPKLLTKPNTVYNSSAIIAGVKYIIFFIIIPPNPDFVL